MFHFFFFQAEDGIRDIGVTGVQTCALPIFLGVAHLGFGSQHAPDLLKEGVGRIVVAAVVGLALANKEIRQALLLLATFGKSHRCTSEKGIRPIWRMPVSLSCNRDASRDDVRWRECFTLPPSSRALQPQQRSLL